MPQITTNHAATARIEYRLQAGKGYWATERLYDEDGHETDVGSVSTDWSPDKRHILAVCDERIATLARRGIAAEAVETETKCFGDDPRPHLNLTRWRDR